MERQQALNTMPAHGERMKPPPFSYHDPESVEDVLALLGRLENATLLAGGQSLMPMLNMRLVLPDHLVDLNRVAALSYIRGDGEALHIGAMTRQRDLEFSAAVHLHCPLMAEALQCVGHRQTRNRGTLGGSLSHLDPAAELVAVAAALEATIEIQGPAGTRTLPVDEFAAGYMTPAIEPGELMTAVRFPVWPEGHGYAFVEFARRQGDFAIVSAAALLEEGDNGTITRASLTLGGVGFKPVRLSNVERALTGEAASDELFRAACEAARDVEALDDVHAPASYRQHLAAVLARRALETAHRRAQAGIPS